MSELYPQTGYAKRRELNEQQAAARQNAIALAASGARVSVFPNGTVVTGNRRQNVRARGTPPHPFKLSNATEGSVLKVGVYPGLVNAIVPTLGGTALDATTPPLATITATTYFWLKCVGTFGATDTYVVTIETSATSTPPSGTAITGTGFTSYLLIGWATVASAEITGLTQTAKDDFWVESYGSTNIWFR